MSCKTGSRLTLAQCIRLQQNNFLSSDLKTEYQHEEVISRLIELQSRRDDRNIQNTLKALLHANLEASDDMPPPIPYEAMLEYAEELI